MSTKNLSGKLKRVVKIEIPVQIYLNRKPTDLPIGELAGFPWNLSVIFCQSSVSVTVVCNEGNLSSVWSCKARCTLERASSDLEQVMKSHVFSAAQNSLCLIINGERIGNFLNFIAPDGVTKLLLTIEINTNIGLRTFNAYDYSMKSKYSDMVLVVADRRFHVSKSVLALNSPFFDTLFNTEFSEKDKEEIELKDVDPNEFEMFLNVIYPSSYIVTKDTVEFLLKLADRFQCDKVLIDCDDFLCETITSCQTIDKLRFLTLADDYRLPKVAEEFVDKLKNPSTDIRVLAKNKEFHSLTSDIKEAFLERLVI